MLPKPGKHMINFDNNENHFEFIQFRTALNSFTWQKCNICISEDILMPKMPKAKKGKKLIF